MDTTSMLGLILENACVPLGTGLRMMRVLALYPDIYLFPFKK